jgi:hypothetical protein
MENVIKINMCIAQLKYNVVFELQKNINFQHDWKLIACNDAVIKHKRADESFMCQYATRTQFRTVSFMFWIFIARRNFLDYI